MGGAERALVTTQASSWVDLHQGREGALDEDGMKLDDCSSDHRLISLEEEKRSTL